MTEKLAASCLLIGFALAGCMGTNRQPADPADGSSAGSTGGAGGATNPGSGGGPPGGGGADGGRVVMGSGGAGPINVDATTPAVSPDARGVDGAAPPVTGGDVWAVCGAVTFKPSIPAADFCTKYMSACTFDPAGGAGGTSRYKSMDDCVTKYNGLTDTPMGGRACVAWQLCIAAHPGNADTYCPRAPEASAMSGPCKMSYL